MKRLGSLAAILAWLFWATAAMAVPPPLQHFGPANPAWPGASANLPSMALNWARPTLTSPVTITIPATLSGGVNTLSDFSSTTYGGSQDCLVVWPSTTHNGTVEINGCHNIVMIGGENTRSPQQGDVSNTANSRLIYIKGATGTVSIEGFHGFTGGPTSGDAMSDCIDTGDGTTATIQIQNTLCEGMYGWTGPTATDTGGTSQWQFHADCVQPFGGSGPILMFNVTCHGYYQGFTMGVTDAAITSLTMINVNADINGEPQTYSPHSNGGYLLYFASGASCSTDYPTTFQAVYLGSNRTERTDLSYLVGTPGTTGQGSCDNLTGSLTGQAQINGAQFAGNLTWGFPPGGDFAPANRVGLHYPASGY